LPFKCNLQRYTAALSADTGEDSPELVEPEVGAGFIFVQVLAPGQKASGMEYFRVLMVDCSQMKLELDALERGACDPGAANEAAAAALGGAAAAAAVGTAGGQGARQQRPEEDAAAGQQQQPQPQPQPQQQALWGFQSRASFHRFLRDLGWLLEGDAKTSLYTTAGRHAVRHFAQAWSGVTGRARLGHRVSALTSVVWEILADVDDQADFQKETEIFEARQQRSDPKRDQGLQEFAHRPSNLSTQGDGDGDLSTRRATHQQTTDADGSGSGGSGALDIEIMFVPGDRHLFLHRAAGMTQLITILVSMIKCSDWGIPLATISLCQTGTLVYALFFSVVVAQFPSVAAWAARQFEGKGVVSKRCVDVFDRCVPLMSMTQNAILSALFDLDYFVPRGEKVLGVTMHVANLVYLGLFRAEAAPLSALRYDIALQGAIHIALAFAAHQIIHGHVRIMNEIAFNGTVNAIFWSWFVPVAIATMIRNMYRNDLRVVEKLRAAQKAKKFR
jgi:hypothetical protein